MQLVIVATLGDERGPGGGLAAVAAAARALEPVRVGSCHWSNAAKLVGLGAKREWSMLATPRGSEPARGRRRRW